MNVVVVDNDTALLRSLQLSLSARGHAVRTFCDPFAACAFLEDGGTPDVLLLDYRMPGLNGVQTLHRVAGNLPAACRVILMSGHSDVVENLDLAALRTAAFVPKPLDLDRLCTAIEGSHGEHAP